uniref:Uncharacterized protein n=1 Tax=Anguilla anguilla TaxID=7936 RepID=A0A0E9WUM8_ANGAN
MESKTVLMECQRATKTSAPSTGMATPGATLGGASRKGFFHFFKRKRNDSVIFTRLQMRFPSLSSLVLKIELELCDAAHYCGRHLNPHWIFLM